MREQQQITCRGAWIGILRGRISAEPAPGARLFVSGIARARGKLSGRGSRAYGWHRGRILDGVLHNRLVSVLPADTRKLVRRRGARRWRHERYERKADRREQAARLQAFQSQAC